MHVDIYSDIACPWCYVGKHRFEEALKRWGGHADVTVTMRPFQLGPDLPTDPALAVPASGLYAQRFGAEQFAGMQAHLTKVAAEVGIDYQADKVMAANTLSAHRLLLFALAQGGTELQARVAEAVFQAYFTHGQIVSDHAVLTEIAATEGLPAAAVRAYLDSDAGVMETQEAIANAGAGGVTAVPFFVFEDQYAVSGAQDVDTFLQVLDAVEKELTKV